MKLVKYTSTCDHWEVINAHNVPRATLISITNYFARPMTRMSAGATYFYILDRLKYLPM